jgi:hypothetical protein
VETETVLPLMDTPSRSSRSDPAATAYDGIVQVVDAVTVAEVFEPVTKPTAAFADGPPVRNVAPTSIARPATMPSGTANRLWANFEAEDTRSPIAARGAAHM